jgi:hypothetical protein
MPNQPESPPEPVEGAVCPVLLRRYKSRSEIRTFSKNWRENSIGGTMKQVYQPRPNSTYSGGISYDQL